MILANFEMLRTQPNTQNIWSWTTEKNLAKVLSESSWRCELYCQKYEGKEEQVLRSVTSYPLDIILTD